MIISKTPFRISFFGGGTDYPAWYIQNGGTVLSTTIDKYCYVSVRYLPPFFEHKHRIVYSNIENVREIREIKHPSVRAILEYFKIKKGIEIHHDADLPARSGLGSSSAFTVGILNAFYALKGSMISKIQLAKEAIKVERDILKENVGCQDQIATAHGGFNKITISSDHNFKVEPITLQRARTKLLEEHMMLIFTGFSRYASEIAAEQIKNTADKKEELVIMHQLVADAMDILNSDADIIEFGKLLDRTWQLKKRLSNKISNSSIDSLYECAIKNGAVGGKLLGAGGGGFMLLFVPPENKNRLRASLKKFLEVKFSFENNGSQIIYYTPHGI